MWETIELGWEEVGQRKGKHLGQVQQALGTSSFLLAPMEEL